MRLLCQCSKLVALKDPYFFKCIYLLNYIDMYVCMLDMYRSVGACRGQKRASGPLALELQVIMGCPL